MESLTTFNTAPESQVRGAVIQDSFLLIVAVIVVSAPQVGTFYTFFNKKISTSVAILQNFSAYVIYSN